jgi:hypothetical protein
MPADKAVLAFPITATEWNSFNGSDTLTIIYSNRSTPVLRMALPQTSVLRDVEHYDYSHSFISTCKDGAGLQPEALVRAFADALPAWAKWIIAGSCSQKINLNSTCHEAPVLHAAYAPFRISYGTDDEVILERQNEHRSIYVSILLGTPRRDALQKNIILSVMVQTHNGRSRFYSRMLNKLFQTLMPGLLKHLVMLLNV